MMSCNLSRNRTRHSFMSSDVFVDFLRQLRHAFVFVFIVCHSDNSKGQNFLPPSDDTCDDAKLRYWGKGFIY